MSSVDNELLWTLYLGVTHERGLPPREERPASQYQYLPEATRASEEIDALCDAILTDINGELAHKLNDLVADLSDAYERQGFLNGFQYGVRLAKLLESLGPAERERERVNLAPREGVE